MPKTPTNSHQYSDIFNKFAKLIAFNLFFTIQSKREYCSTFALAMYNAYAIVMKST